MPQGLATVPMLTQPQNIKILQGNSNKFLFWVQTGQTVGVKTKKQYKPATKQLNERKVTFSTENRKGNSNYFYFKSL